MREKTPIVFEKQNNLKVSKVKLTIITSLILKCVLLALFWSEYSKIAPSPYQIWGADEAHWVKKSILVEQAIERKGVISTLFDLTNVVSTWHCGWPFLAGYIFFIFGENVFVVLLLKQFIYAIGTLYIYKLSLLVTSSYKTSYMILLFSVIYPPLTIYSVSFMREEILFSFISITLYLIMKRNSVDKAAFYELFIILNIMIILTFRVHVGCVFIIVYFISIFNNNLNFKNFIYRCFILLFITFLTSEYIAYGIRMISANGFSFSLVEYVYSFTRFLLSPLPWKMEIDNHNYYNIWWYCITLPLIILSILFSNYILQSINKNKILILFILMYFFCYMLNVKILGASNLAIGPRQFSLIGPLFFLTAYSTIFSKVKLY